MPLVVHTDTKQCFRTFVYSKTILFICWKSKRINLGIYYQVSHNGLFDASHSVSIEDFHNSLAVSKFIFSL